MISDVIADGRFRRRQVGNADAGLMNLQNGQWTPFQLAAYMKDSDTAGQYASTVTLTATLKTPNGTETRSISATVTAGRVTCRVKGPSDPAFEGPGLLAVEHGNTANAGEYVIQVWCPDAPGGKASGDDAPAIDSYRRQAASYALLEGRDEHEHPDADAANGVAGTETVTWSLRR